MIRPRGSPVLELECIGDEDRCVHHLHCASLRDGRYPTTTSESKLPRTWICRASKQLNVVKLSAQATSWYHVASYCRYTVRKAKDSFRASAGVSDSQEQQALWSKAKEQYDVIARQAIVYSLYARKQRSVMVSQTPGLQIMRNSHEIATFRATQSLLQIYLHPACQLYQMLHPRHCMQQVLSQ